MSHVKHTFKKYWAQMRRDMARLPETAALVSQLPNSRDVYKACRDVTFAELYFARLESMGAFEFMIQRMAMYCKSAAEMHDLADMWGERHLIGRR